MLKPEGVLYISFPIGKANEVHFNAHRVFHPLDVFNWADKNTGLELMRFDFVDDNGNLHQKADPKTNLNISYGCGIYTFKKLH